MGACKTRREIDQGNKQAVRQQQRVLVVALPAIVKTALLLFRNSRFTGGVYIPSGPEWSKTNCALVSS